MCGPLRLLLILGLEVIDQVTNNVLWGHLSALISSMYRSWEIICISIWDWIEGKNENRIQVIHFSICISQHRKDLRTNHIKNASLLPEPWEIPSKWSEILQRFLKIYKFFYIWDIPKFYCNYCRSHRTIHQFFLFLKSKYIHHLTNNKINKYLFFLVEIDNLVFKACMETTAPSQTDELPLTPAVMLMQLTFLFLYLSYLYQTPWLNK